VELPLKGHLRSTMLSVNTKHNDIFMLHHFDNETGE